MATKVATGIFIRNNNTWKSMEGAMVRKNNTWKKFNGVKNNNVWYTLPESRKIWVENINVNGAYINPTIGTDLTINKVLYVSLVDSKEPYTSATITLGGLWNQAVASNIQGFKTLRLTDNKLYFEMTKIELSYFGNIIFTMFDGNKYTINLNFNLY